MAFSFGFAKRDLCMYCITFGLMLSRWTIKKFCICRIRTKGKLFYLALVTHLRSCVIKWCLLKKGKWEFLCAAFPLFFSRRMMTWILMYLQSNTPQPSPLFQLSLCFFLLDKDKKVKSNILIEQWTINTLLLTFLSLSLSVFLYLSLSFLFSCHCLLLCSCLCLCLCSCSCLVLDLVSLPVFVIVLVSVFVHVLVVVFA